MDVQILLCKQRDTVRGKCLQKITGRNLYASDINFHSLSADAWAEKPHKCPWMRARWRAPTELQCLESAGKQRATNSWASKGASPGRGSRRRRCCSAQLQWGTDYPHLRAGRVWNGNEEEISLPQYPAATADAALRQQGSRQHAAGTFVSPLFSSSQSPPLTVTQKVSYRNGARTKYDFYLHILALIPKSLCVWRLQLVYSKQSKLHKSHPSGLGNKTPPAMPWEGLRSQEFQRHLSCRKYTESQSPRTVWLGRDLGDVLIPPPAM